MTDATPMLDPWPVWLDRCEDAGLCAGEYGAGEWSLCRWVFRRGSYGAGRARAMWRHPPAPVRDDRVWMQPRCVELGRWCHPLPGSEQWERGY